MQMNLPAQVHPEDGEQTSNTFNDTCSDPSNSIKPHLHYDTLLRLKKELRELPFSVGPVKMVSSKDLTGESFRGSSSPPSELHQELHAGAEGEPSQAPTPLLTPVSPAAADGDDDESSLSPHEVAALHAQEIKKKSRPLPSSTGDIYATPSTNDKKQVMSQFRGHFSDNLLTDELARPGDDHDDVVDDYEDDGEMITVYSFTNGSSELKYSRKPRRLGEGTRGDPESKKKRSKTKRASSRGPMPVALGGPASRNAELYKRLQIFDWSMSSLTLAKKVPTSAPGPNNADGASGKKKGKKSKHRKHKKDRKMDSSCSVSKDPSTAATAATEPSTPIEPRRRTTLPSIRASTGLLADPVEYSPSKFNDSVMSTQSAPDRIVGRLSRRNASSRKKKKSSGKHHSHRRRKKHSKRVKERSISRIQEDDGEDEADDDDDIDNTDAEEVDHTERFWKSEPAVGYFDRREEFSCSERERTQRISNKSSGERT